VKVAGRTDHAFYEREYAGEKYRNPATLETSAFAPLLKQFISQYSLEGSRCLEVGCGNGVFQDAVPRFFGADLSLVAGRELHKPFCQTDATELAFASDSFDAVWSFAVLEHIARPESTLEELRRVLRDGGLLLLCPAWQCRPWAAQGYSVRPYRELPWKAKLVKLSIPLRDSVAFRALHIFPGRLAALAAHALARRPTRLRYRPLNPNYETFWTSDSDAAASIDPYQAILWFVSRGDQCLNYPTTVSQFLVRTGALVIRVKKP
jgi:SAM-dependent methyltransferase